MYKTADTNGWGMSGRWPVEALVWLTGLLVITLPDPTVVQSWTLCLFETTGVHNLLGLPACPGCGLGHAVGFLFRGELVASFQAHPLGIPVAGILAGRSIKVISDSLRTGSGRAASVLWPK